MFWLRNKKINFCYAYLSGGLFNYYTLQGANRKDADQTVQIGMLICGCIGCMQQNHDVHRGPFIVKSPASLNNKS